MCQPHPTAERLGVRLEDGDDAHAHDHAAWTRRDFLRRMGLATVGAGFVASGLPIGVFGQAPVLDVLARTETDRVLVLVQLSGGNDGLNTLVPVSNDVYYQKRGALAIPATDALALDAPGGGASGWALHPSLASLAPLWNDGRMGLVHAVGYANHNRSHFVSTDNWTSGSGGGTTMPYGWAGRYLLADRDPGAPDDFYRTSPPALALGSTAQMFASAEGNVSVAPLAFTTNIRALVERGVVYDPGGLPTDQPFAAPVKYLRDTVNVTLGYVVRFVEATNAAPNRATYPNATAGSLASQLALAARVVRGGLSPRILSVSLGGFDTHANQANAHAGLLAQLADALRAFFDDLAADGLDRRVVAMTFSEFGRTVTANASGGTDHGSAAPVLLLGPAVEGGFFGTAPNLVNDQDRDGVGPTTDYRSLYATLLERWFNVPAADVDALLGRSTPRLGFLPSTPTARDSPDAATSGDALLAPAPNPFTERTALTLRTAQGGPARLEVFDALGRRVAHLFDGTLPPGEHLFDLDGSTLAPGLYLARLDTLRGTASRPVVRVR